MFLQHFVPSWKKCPLLVEMVVRLKNNINNATRTKLCRTNLLENVFSSIFDLFKKIHFLAFQDLFTFCLKVRFLFFVRKHCFELFCPKVRSHFDRTAPRFVRSISGARFPAMDGIPRARASSRFAITVEVSGRGLNLKPRVVKVHYFGAQSVHWTTFKVSQPNRMWYNILSYEPDSTYYSIQQFETEIPTKINVRPSQHHRCCCCWIIGAV